MRASIAVQISDGSIRAVYCHREGEPSGVGETLVCHFDSQELAEQLVALGDLDVVAGATSLEEVEAYHRDCGEKFHAFRYTTMAEYFRSAGEIDLGERSYRYVFADGHWHVWCEDRQLARVDGRWLVWCDARQLVKVEVALAVVEVVDKDLALRRSLRALADGGNAIAKNVLKRLAEAKE